MISSDACFRPISIADLDIVCKLHIEAFDQNFLSLLGQKSVKSYYSCFIDSDVHIGIVVELNGNIQGAILATRDKKKLYTFLYKNHFKTFLFSTLIALMEKKIPRHSFILRLPQVYLALSIKLNPFKKVENNKVFDANYFEPSFRLLSIFVNQEYWGKNIATQLVDNLVSRLKKSFIVGTIRLTVAKKNLRAIKFYEKAGWTLDIGGSSSISALVFYLQF